MRLVEPLENLVVVVESRPSVSVLILGMKFVTVCVWLELVGLSVMQFGVVLAPLLSEWVRADFQACCTYHLVRGGWDMDRGRWLCLMQIVVMQMAVVSTVMSCGPLLDARYNFGKRLEAAAARSGVDWSTENEGISVGDMVSWNGDCRFSRLFNGTW